MDIDYFYIGSIDAFNDFIIRIRRTYWCPVSISHSHYIGIIRGMFVDWATLRENYDEIIDSHDLYSIREDFFPKNNIITLYIYANWLNDNGMFNVEIHANSESYRVSFHDLKTKHNQVGGYFLFAI
jgi:DNA mismatch repair ATPase MutS